MLYVYYGEGGAPRLKIKATIKKLLFENKDAHYVRITKADFGKYDFTELAESQALFKSEYIVFFDGISDDEEFQNKTIEFAEQFAESTNLFFLFFKQADGRIVERLQKCANKIQKFDLGNKKVKNENNEKFNIFAIADAFGEGDRKRLWTLFRKAKLNGASDEEIQGILFWIIKSMFIAAKSKSAREAGLSPFVFKKAKRFVEKTDEEKLSRLLNRITTLPYESRRTGVPMEIGIERFILKGA